MVRPRDETKRALPSLLIALTLALACTGVGASSSDLEHAYPIFEDDFEGGSLDNWEMWTPQDAAGDASWAVLYENGNNYMSLRGPVIARTGGHRWVNYTLEVRVRFGEGTEEGHINVRMGDPAPRYFVRLPQEAVILAKEYMGEFTDLAEAEFERDVGVWHEVRVVCEGPILSVYIDGEQLIDFEDMKDPLISGGIGLEGGPDTEILFDDVKVYVEHWVLVEKLLKDAEDAINGARLIGADTRGAEGTLEEARVKLEEGDMVGAEALAREAATEAAAAREAKESETENPPPESGQGLTWSVELVAGIVSIGGAGLGLAGWLARTRSAKRRGRILFRKLLEEVDDAYGSFKMNSRRCEGELLRLKAEVLAGFKEGVIEEGDFHTLDARIDTYIREVRSEIEREDASSPKSA